MKMFKKRPQLKHFSRKIYRRFTWKIIHSERFKVGVLLFFFSVRKIKFKIHRSDWEMGCSAAVREKEGEGTSGSFPEERVQPKPEFETISQCETNVPFPEERREVTRK